MVAAIPDTRSGEDFDREVLKTIRRLRIGAVAVGLSVALSLPGVRLYFGVQAKIIALDVEIERMVDDFSRQASRAPHRWGLQHNDLTDSLETVVRRESINAAKLTDTTGRELASAGTWIEQDWPNRRAGVIDSGVAVATIHAQATVSDLIPGVLRVGLLGLLLGLTAWWLIARIALRSLERTFDGLTRARLHAETAGKARSSFLATMSHEIRTPMNGVVGMASLLLETKLTETQRHYAEVIHSSGDSLLVVINEILEFSKVSSGNVVLEPLAFNPETLAEDVLILLSAEANRKQLEILCRVKTGVPHKVWADATRLRQILVNVIGNAIKFTDTGEVVVTVASPSEGRLSYTVQDTGIGIKKEQGTAIFDPFSQADATTTRRFGGSGLGLAISRRMVELMGGTITVASEPGEGSTFVIDIAATQVASLEVSTTAPGESLFGKRVLLIDDNATQLELLRTLALSWGMQPEPFGSPLHAIEAFGAGAGYDLVVLDSMMPEMNGTALAEKLHAVRPDMPIVLLSTADDGDAVNPHFAARLHKPIRRMQLADTLRSVLGGKPVSTPTSEQSVVGESIAQSERRAICATRVLLIEDFPVNAVVLRLMLERLGYGCDHAPSGQEGLNAIKRQPYDLVFMDVQMPGMNGVEATRHLRAMKSIKQPYIVAFTANVMEEDREACIAAGMNAFLGKPARLADLQICLAQYEDAVAA